MQKKMDKVQHTFMIKTLNKPGIEGFYLNIIKSIYEKPTMHIIHSGEIVKAFSYKNRYKAKMPVLTIQHGIGSPSQYSWT